MTSDSKPQDRGRPSAGGNGPTQFAEAALAADACALRVISRTSRAVIGAFDPMLRDYRLTGHQYTLLSTLEQHQPLTVGKLGATLVMDPSGIPRAIKPLVKNGWVRVDRGADKRQRVIQITDSGRAILRQAEPAWRAVQTRIMTEFGDSDWLAVVGQLDRIRAIASNGHAVPGDA
jgi:DNA-binding MarR family transcriptional regulator